MNSRVSSALWVYRSLIWGWVRNKLGLVQNKKPPMGQPVDAVVSDVRAVLLFGYMGLGDAIMFEPTLRWLIEKYPAATIDLVVGSASQSFPILARIMEMNNRQFRRVYNADPKSMSGRELSRLNAELSEVGYDLCVASYTTPTPYFVRAVQSGRWRVGHAYSPQPWYKPRPNYLFNFPVHVHQKVDEHEILRQFRLVEALGAQSSSIAPTPLFSAPQHAREWASNFIRDARLEGKRLICVHIGASKAMEWKTWPNERFGAVFSHLASPDTHFLFFGAGSEAEQIEAARKMVQLQSTNLAGTIDVIQVTALIERCQMMIGNDSGIGHLALVQGIRTLRLFGPSDYHGYRSYAEGHSDKFKGLTCSPCWRLGSLVPGYNVTNCGHRNCFMKISVEEVTRTAVELLNAVPRSQDQAS